ncbi:MAG: TPM domain-containing protein [Lachnospiraceae bacterium]|nr:TPM domain-containing protein [Lachnospiraceae bacterium]
MRDCSYKKTGRLRIWAFVQAAVIFAMTLGAPLFALCVRAEEDSQQTALYDVYIADYADLLTVEEENELYDVMVEGTDSGNMVFMTIDDSAGYVSKDYIEMIYQTTDTLRDTDAVIYLIDMDNRMLWITGYEALKKLVTPDYANLITDNVYRYAESGDYASCAITGYRQIVQRVKGSRVSGALRSVGNLCIAVIAAEVLCFAFAYVSSASRKAKDKEILDHVEQIINIQNPSVKKTGSKRIYDPPKSSSSSGGGGRSGGGGGGFSGGGGGHGF